MFQLVDGLCFFADSLRVSIMNRCWRFQPLYPVILPICEPNFASSNMGGSINGGTPKWMVYSGKIRLNWMISGYPYFRKPSYHPRSWNIWNKHPHTRAARLHPNHHICDRQRKPNLHRSQVRQTLQMGFCFKTSYFFPDVIALEWRNAVVSKLMFLMFLLIIVMWAVILSDVTWTCPDSQKMRWSLSQIRYMTWDCTGHVLSTSKLLYNHLYNHLYTIISTISLDQLSFYLFLTSQISMSPRKPVFADC